LFLPGNLLVLYSFGIFGISDKIRCCL
jgi:hypothetical protein